MINAYSDKLIKWSVNSKKNAIFANCSHKNHMLNLFFRNQMLYF